MKMARLFLVKEKNGSNFGWTIMSFSEICKSGDVALLQLAEKCKRTMNSAEDEHWLVSRL
jgi:hypothetical protein